MTEDWNDMNPRLDLTDKKDQYKKLKVWDDNKNTQYQIVGPTVDNVIPKDYNNVQISFIPNFVAYIYVNDSFNIWIA